MWHLKTKAGVFWIVESAQSSGKYLLGVDDKDQGAFELGTYTDVDTAIKTVSQQETGHFSWDNQTRVRIPANIGQWQQGVPNEWQEPN